LFPEHFSGSSQISNFVGGIEETQKKLSQFSPISDRESTCKPQKIKPLNRDI
jgi:hypothetical protein